MKTLKDFFNQYYSEEKAKFMRKVWKMGGVDWSDFKECPWGFQDASSGSVSGCIYYADTCKFAKKNLLEIIYLVHEYESGIGQVLTKKPNVYEDGETTFLNWMTWFAWESLANDLISYLEN